MRYEWQQCDNYRAHLPHADEDGTTITFCEGVSPIQSLMPRRNP